MNKIKIASTIILIPLILITAVSAFCYSPDRWNTVCWPCDDWYSVYNCLECDFEEGLIFDTTRVKDGDNHWRITYSNLRCCNGYSPMDPNACYSKSMTGDGEYTISATCCGDTERSTPCTSHDGNQDYSCTCCNEPTYNSCGAVYEDTADGCKEKDYAYECKQCNRDSVSEDCEAAGKSKCCYGECFNWNNQHCCGDECSHILCNNDQTCYDKADSKDMEDYDCCDNNIHDSNGDGHSESCCPDDKPHRGPLFDWNDLDGDASTAPWCMKVNSSDGYFKETCYECYSEDPLEDDNQCAEKYGSSAWACCAGQCYDVRKAHCCTYDLCQPGPLIAGGNDPSCPDWEECCDTNGDYRKDSVCKTDENCRKPIDPKVDLWVNYACVKGETDCKDNYDNDGDSKVDCEDPECESKQCSEENETKQAHCGVCIRTSHLEGKICCGKKNYCGTITGAVIKDASTGCMTGDEYNVSVDYNKYCYTGSCMPNQPPYIKGDEPPPNISACSLPLPIIILCNPWFVPYIYYINVPPWEGFHSCGYKTQFKDGGSCRGHEPEPEGYREETPELELECKILRNEEEVPSNTDCNALEVDPNKFTEDELITSAGTIKVEDDGRIEDKCLEDNIKESSRPATILCPGGVRDLGDLSYHGSLRAQAKVLTFIGMEVGWIKINIAPISINIDPNDKFCGYPKGVMNIGLWLHKGVINKAGEYLGEFILKYVDHEDVPEGKINEILNSNGQVEAQVVVEIKEGYTTVKGRVDYYLYEGKRRLGGILEPKLVHNSYIIDSKICTTKAKAIEMALALGEYIRKANLKMNGTKVTVMKIGEAVGKTISMDDEYDEEIITKFQSCCPNDVTCEDGKPVSRNKATSGGKASIKTNSSSTFFVHGATTSAAYYVSPSVSFNIPIDIELDYSTSSNPDSSYPKLYKVSDAELEGIPYVDDPPITYTVTYDGGTFSSADGAFRLIIPRGAVFEDTTIQISVRHLLEDFIQQPKCTFGSDCGSWSVGGAIYCKDAALFQSGSYPVCKDSGSGRTCSTESYEALVDMCDFNEVCSGSSCQADVCTDDTDGGFMPASPGSVMGNVYNFTDGCFDTNVLVEFSCIDGYVDYQLYKCPCLDGVCKPLLADRDGNGIVTIEEMLRYFEDYYNGRVSYENLIKAYEEWKIY